MNVQEILNISKERKIKNKGVIKKIVENIHKKIKYYATAKKESCSYIIPPIVDDTPLYDIENVIKEIFKILDSEGYIVTAYSNGQLDVCWNEVLVEQKVKTDAYVLNSEGKKIKNITKKVKNIDDRFSFLANPKKTINNSIDKQIDDQIDKILKEKSKNQQKYKNLL